MYGEMKKSAGLFVCVPGIILAGMTFIGCGGGETG